MLDHYEKFRILDGKKVNTFTAEVNWDKNDKTTNECKVIKFTFPDGKEAFVKKEYLNALLFIIGTAEEQKKMIPQKITKVRYHRGMATVVTQRNIEKGDRVTFEVRVPCMDQEQEIIGNLRSGDYLPVNK